MWQRHQAERGVWSEKMLVALEMGVKGNKWFSLIDKVCRLEVLERAWEKVRSNAGAGGVDRLTIETFAKDSPKRLLAVKEQIEKGLYQPEPVKRVWIPKPGSAEKRPLGIPTVRDRVVQTALKMVLEPIFEREFAPTSYGFRPGRSGQEAVRRVEGLLESGHVHVVDIDIRGYFEAIPHKRLLAEVSKHVADRRVLGLLEAFLQAKVMEELRSWRVESGTPQGGVISPLLANVYLNPLDWLLAQRGWELVRYADDLVVLCRTAQEAEQALAAIRVWLEAAGLELHPAKTKVVDMAQAGAHFDFLGFRFWRQKTGGWKRLVRPKSQQRLRERIKPLTKQCSGQSLEAVIARLNPILRGWWGWWGYFRQASASALGEMDGWVRGRLRAILRKRDRRQGRGQGKDHYRWPNCYFAELGLFSLQAARGRL